MQASPVATLSCSQCGGELHPQEGEVFLTCPFCNSTVFVDKSQVVFHWFVAPTLDQQQAAGQLARWMSGNQTVKNLDKKAQVTGQTFQYFPVWYFRLGRSGQEVVALQPAAATSITEVARLNIPAGDLRPYDPSVELQSMEPTVPLEAARQWLEQSQPGAEVREGALVHIPIYIFKYTYRNLVFTALVEAGTGTVLANIFPAKSEAPYYLAALLTALVFMALAAIPLGSPLLTPVALTAALVAAPLLFILAVVVASKV
jgi:hypothetical protein